MNPNPKNNRVVSYADAMKLEVVKRCVLSPVFVSIDAPNIIPWGRGHSYQVGFGPNKGIPRVSDFGCIWRLLLGSSFELFWETVRPLRADRCVTQLSYSVHLQFSWWTLFKVVLLLFTLFKVMIQEQINVKKIFILFHNNIIYRNVHGVKFSKKWYQLQQTKQLSS